LDNVEDGHANYTCPYYVFKIAKCSPEHAPKISLIVASYAPLCNYNFIYLLLTIPN